MNILVFVKQIPDTTEVKLDPKTGNLCRFFRSFISHYN